MSFGQHLAEEVVQAIDYDAVSSHLVLLTLRYTTLLYLVDVGLGYAHQAEAFSWGEFADAVGVVLFTFVTTRSFPTRHECRRHLSTFLHSSATGLAVGIGDIEYASGRYFDVALLGGLGDAERFGYEIILLNGSKGIRYTIGTGFEFRHVVTAHVEFARLVLLAYLLAEVGAFRGEDIRFGYQVILLNGSQCIAYIVTHFEELLVMV